MSFSIVLMRNDSDTNVVSKTLATLSTVTGVLKESTSIMNPIIRIEGSIPTTCNYMYISTFGRYYYVTDIISITNDIFEIHAHVDVLQTYGSSIKNCTGIVARQQEKWNLYLDDGSFKTYQNDKTKAIAFSGGFTSEQFLIAIAGA